MRAMYNKKRSMKEVKPKEDVVKNHDLRVFDENLAKQADKVELEAFNPTFVVDFDDDSSDEEA